MCGQRKETSLNRNLTNRHTGEFATRGEPAVDCVAADRGMRGAAAAPRTKFTMASATALDARVTPIARRFPSEQQLRVLHLIAVGMPDKAIAETLDISDRMVRKHVAECRKKLSAESRAMLVAIAVQQGAVKVITEADRQGLGPTPGPVRWESPARCLEAGLPCQRPKCPAVAPGPYRLPHERINVASLRWQQPF